MGEMNSMYTRAEIKEFSIEVEQCMCLYPVP
jgi:hypothetical protein